MNKKMMKGFTLIEIMIVVAIIAVLAAVAIPSFAKYMKRSSAGACQTTRESIKKAAYTYSADNNGTSTIALTDLYKADGSGYLVELPHCPDSGEYSISKDAESGVITVSCTKHTASGTEPETPSGD